MDTFLPYPAAFYKMSDGLGGNTSRNERAQIALICNNSTMIYEQINCLPRTHKHSYFFRFVTRVLSVRPSVHDSMLVIDAI